MSDGVVFTPSAAERISRVVRHVEPRMGLGLRPEQPPRVNESLYTVLVTSEAAYGGSGSGSGDSGSGGGSGSGSWCVPMYPAVITTFDQETCDWLEFDSCRLMTPNGETLTVGRRYRASPVAVLSSGELLLLLAGGLGGSGTCTVTFVTRICRVGGSGSGSGSGSGGPSGSDAPPP